MKKVLLQMKLAAVFLMAAVFALFIFYSKQQDAKVKSAARITVPALGPESSRPQAPVWSGVDDKGATIDLAKLRGRVVHLVFWAQWCAPCERELPALNAFAKEHSDKYTLLTFDMDDNDGDRNAARKMLQNLAPDLTGIFKNTQKLAEDLHIEALPYHVVIDPQGRVAATFIAAITDDLPAFKKIIDGL